MQTSDFEIFDMLTRAQLTGQAIYIAAKLRIADYLKDGAKSVEEIAERTETHPDSLYRLLRMLASIGIFAEIKEEDDKQEQANQRIRIRFELTPMASLLQSETENSIRNFALMFGLESFKKAIDDLSYSIQTGENSFKHANGLEMYEYFEQNQKEAQIFNGAMASLTSSHASLISSMYDFSQFNSIIDIGGGQGAFLSSILKNNPNLHGVLFDLPHAIETANGQMSLSEYMQQALVEAMRFDIEEGNLCDALLEKIGIEDNKKNNSSPSPSTTSPFASGLTNNDLDLLKKLQTQI